MSETWSLAQKLFTPAMPAKPVSWVPEPTDLNVRFTCACGFQIHEYGLPRRPDGVIKRLRNEHLAECPGKAVAA